MALDYDDRDGINGRHALHRMISVGAASVLVVSVDRAKPLNLLASAVAQALPTVPIIVRDKTSLFGQIVLAGARKAGQDLGGRPSPDAGRQVPLRQRARHQHDRGLQGRSR